MGVSSGFWEGKATTAPLARGRVATAESNKKRVLLIPYLLLYRGRGRKDQDPNPFLISVIISLEITNLMCGSAHAGT
jgi:hypothetical protein